MKRLLYLILLLVYVPGYAVTITAAPGGGNWSNTATWVGAATPTAANDVLLAITSGSVTVDVGTALALSVTATAFTNNLQFSAGQTLTVSGNVQLDTIVSGMTVKGTGVLAVNAACAFLSAGQTITGSLINSGVAITNGDGLTVAQDVITNVGSSTFNGAVTINVGRNLTMNTNLQGSDSFNFFGSGTWSGAGISTQTSNYIFNTSGTITLGSSLTFSGTGPHFIYTTGTIVTTGNTMNLQRLCTFNTGIMHWNNLTFNFVANSTTTVQSQLIADGAVSFIGTAATARAVSFTGAFNLTFGELDSPGLMTYTFPAGVTLSVSKIFYSLGSPTGTVLFNSATASSSVFLKYSGGCAGSRLFFTNFTDFDASPSPAPVTVFDSSALTRATNFSTTPFTNQNCGSSRGYFF